MEAQPINTVTRMFKDIEHHDPRAVNARHYLTDILVITLVAVMGGADDYRGIVEYAKDEQAWLKTFLPLPHGIPSISTFRRIFAALNPVALEGVLQRWAGEIAVSLVGKQICLDGKTLRRSFEQGWKKSGLHLVTAWCAPENLVLAQQAVDKKSNEITAVPKLLELLDLKGAVVTADALNTQKHIAEQVIKGGGDYLLAVKGNHGGLKAAIKRNMDEMILEKFKDVRHVSHQSTEGGHGRIDTRSVWATDQIDWLGCRAEWVGCKSVAVVDSIRRVIGGETTTQRRYFLSSIKCESGERFAGLIRNHWSIENSQHWTLDMAFNEDQSRVRREHGAQNLAVVRRIGLGLLKRDKSVEAGVKNKRLKAGRNREYLLKVLLATGEAK